MSFQLLAVHFQFVLGVSKLAQQIFHLVLLFAVFSHEFIIFTHESLIFASLVGIKLVKSHLHLLMNACQLVLKNFCFFFDFLSLEEDLIKFRLEFIVLIFNVLISHFNIFWSGVYSELVQGQVVISQLSLKTSDFSGKTFKSFLELVIKLLLFIDSLGFVS